MMDKEKSEQTLGDIARQWDAERPMCIENQLLTQESDCIETATIRANSLL